MIRKRRRITRRKPEDLLVDRVSNHIKTNHPNQPFRFDQIDQIGRKDGKRNKAIHGKWSRGYPDLFIPHVRFSKKGKFKYAGLYVELKATRTVHDTEHTRRQRAYHTVLRLKGYKVEFACGFDEAVNLIDNYLK